MATVTVATALLTIRNTNATLGKLLASAGIDTSNLADTRAGDVVRVLLECNLTDICTAGPPMGTLDPKENREEINAIRKRVIGSGLTKEGRPVERTTSEILRDLAAPDPITEANYRQVLKIMTSGESPDLEHTSGDARGSAYCVADHAAKRFGYPWSEDAILKDRAEKEKGTRGRKKQEIVSLGI